MRAKNYGANISDDLRSKTISATFETMMQDGNTEVIIDDANKVTDATVHDADDASVTDAVMLRQLIKSAGDKITWKKNFTGTLRLWSSLILDKCFALSLSWMLWTLLVP